MFWLAVSIFVYDKEYCQDHQFLLLKHQDLCLVSVTQNTKYSVKIKHIYLEWNKWKTKGSSKSAPHSDLLQQTIKKSKKYC